MGEGAGKRGGARWVGRVEGRLSFHSLSRLGKKRRSREGGGKGAARRQPLGLRTPALPLPLPSGAARVRTTVGGPRVRRRGGRVGGSGARAGAGPGYVEPGRSSEQAIVY